jgi:hypothetical protein
MLCSFMAAKGGPHVQMYRQIVGLAVYILLFTIIGMDQFQVDPAPIFDGFCCLPSRHVSV